MKRKVGQIVGINRKGFENARAMIVGIDAKTVNLFAFREGGKVTRLSIFNEEIIHLEGFKRYKADYIALLNLAVEMDDKAWFDEIHQQFRSDYPVKNI